MALIIFSTILALSALYAPQPLLPVLAEEFEVSREAAASLTTVTFIPLSLAPLFYGFLLETVPARRLLRAAVGLLALSELFFFFGGSFSFLLILRVLQGLLIPAVLTSLMTYVARVNLTGRVQRAMGIYVSATIMGGFLGRACSGLFATWLGWRSSFLVLAASLLLCFFLLARLPDPPASVSARPRPGMMFDLLRRPDLRTLYLAVFSLFLVFSAVMNYLPFRLVEITEGASELGIGLMYTGYMMGIATSLSATGLARLIGARGTMVLGLAVFGCSLVALGVPWAGGLFAAVFLFCGAMFLVHSTASGYLNRIAGNNKGMVNGLYVAFYYGGGVVGSYFPGFAYRHFGWDGFLLLLMAVAALALLLVAKSRPSPQEGGEDHP